jgi:hypothetical protein
MTNKIIVGEMISNNALVVVGAIAARGVKYLIANEIANESNNTSTMTMK